jgi:serine/threonine-protein kinase
VPLEPGSQFDRYVIGALLGHGGMGEVYRAHDSKLQRTVALKVLRALPITAAGDSQPSTDGVARMMREARAAAALDHPNAVAIFDVGQVAGTSYIAMEFIDGKTLRQFVGAEIPMSQRIRWLFDAARALAAAHARGLVHRDIKPENVMVRDDGVVKVLDFGIARRTSKPIDALASTAGITFETLTGKGIVVGTPLYMAPEQMRGEAVTPAADIFSWGVVAYELLRGRSPWNVHASPLEVVSQILSADPEPLRTVAPSVPEGVAAIVMQSLSKAAASRPASMDAIITVLEAHTTHSAQRPAASARTLAAASAPTVAGTSTRSSLTKPEPATTVRSAGRVSRTRIVVGVAGVVAIGIAATIVITRSSRTQSLPASSTQAPTASHSSPSTAAGTFEEATSSNAEATSAYRIAIQASRDAADDVAIAELERAASIDPSFAAAHLRRAIAPAWPDDAAREYYQKAVQLRASLGAHDRALLDAFEPWARFVPDMADSEKRLAAAAAHYPTDTELALLLCRTRIALGDVAGAKSACDAALAIDPNLAAASYLEALAAGVAGDVAGATQAYATCLSHAPSASSCLRDVIELRSNEGSCDEAVQSSRHLVAAYPHTATGHILLAETLYGAGQPIESVRLAFSQAWDWVPKAERTRTELREEAALEIASGELAAAGEKLKALQQEVERSTEEVDHFDVAYARMELALETGQSEEASKIAAEYLKRRAAWTPAPNVDRSLYAERVRYAAGAITKSAFAATRAKWIEREEKRPFQSALFGASPADRWAVAFAGASLTEADARESIAAAPETQAPALLRRNVVWGDAVGAMYSLAGQSEKALPYLERAAKSCGALRDPIASMHASFDLGAAREAGGDVAGACAAYDAVVVRWGAAKPRSVTADRAKQRRTALKCVTTP